MAPQPGLPGKGAVLAGQPKAEATHVLNRAHHAPKSRVKSRRWRPFSPPGAGSEDRDCVSSSGGEGDQRPSPSFHLLPPLSSAVSNQNLINIKY